jgi:hypothetical protein
MKQYAEKVPYPHPIQSERTADSMQKSAQGFSRYFLPREEQRTVMETQSRGIFIPWPLLTIIITVAIVVVSGLIALEVQVSNLNTTLLLRDADTRAQFQGLKDQIATMQVYIQNDREKIIRLETESEIPRDVKRK